MGQWAALSPYIMDSRKRKTDLRTMLNTAQTGTQWRNMDKEYGDWHLVYYYFRKWTKSDAINLIMRTLVQLNRLQEGRNSTPNRVAEIVKV